MGQGPDSPRATRSPELGAFLPSRLTYAWINPLLSLATRRPLAHDDLYPARPTEEATANCDRFLANFEQTKDLKQALIRTWKTAVLITAFVKFVNTSVQIIPFLVMRAFLEWRSDPVRYETDKEYGYLCVGVIFLCMTTKAITENLYFHRSMMIGVQIRVALMEALYRKTLALSMHSRQAFTTGEVVNVMQLWATRMEQFAGFSLHSLWDGFFQIVAYMTVAIWIVGPACLAGVAVMMPIAVMQGKIMKKQGAARRAGSKFTDDRVRMVTEIFAGIRAIKAYCWEEPWGQEVADRRAKEIGFLRRLARLLGWMRGFMSSTPQIIMVAVFATFTLVTKEDMAVSTVFTALAVFSNLRMALMFYPMALAGLVDAKQGIRRMQTYLNAFEVEAQTDAGAPGQIKFTQAAFAYRTEGEQQSREGFDPAPKRAPKKSGKVKDAEEKPEEKPEEKKERLEVLRGVDFSVAPGQLVGIVGPVGSGKTSLCSAVLGELKTTGGKVETGGRKAYAPQVPWIMNATLKDNVLFHRPLDEKRYQWAIGAAQLVSDLELLPDGDQTEIGERGINLSGGQKHRVSLARTIYGEADTYVFDDPLSALDAEVGQAIFRQCVLCPELSKATKVLITHQMSCVASCDLVVTLGLDAEGCGVVESVTTPDKLDAANLKIEDKQPAEEKGEKEGEKDEKKGPAKAVLVEKENKAQGAVRSRVYGDYFRAAGSPVLLFMAFFINASTMFFGNASNFWLSAWSSGSFGLETAEYLGIYAAMAVGMFLASFCGAITVIAVGNRASVNLHGRLFTRLMHAPLSFFDTTPLGRILNRFSHDFEQLDNALPQQLSMTSMIILSLTGALVSICIAMPVFAIGLPFIAAYYYTYLRVFRAANRELKRLDSVAMSPIFQHFQQTLGGVVTIRAYGMLKEYSVMLAQRVNHHTRARYAMMTLNRWLSVRLEFLGAMIMLAIGVLIVTTGDAISPGFGAVALQYALGITGLLNFAVRSAGELEAQMNCVERVVEYIDVVPQEKAYRLPCPDKWPETGAIEFEALSVRYRDGLPLVLKDLSVSIQAQWRVGVVGRTGSGKSTTLLAMLRLIEPASGQVKLGGVPTTEVGLADLRSQLAVIPQEPVLWSGSLRKNLDPFRRCSDEEIWQILDLVEQKLALEQRFEGQSLEQIPVAEYGDNFSHGQRQLFCIVRAILAKAKVVLMDEATSALDERTDAIVQQVIRSRFETSTLLIVAHRLRTIADADRILVLHEGQREDFAPAKELLGRPGRFRDLVHELGPQEQQAIFQQAGYEELQRDV